MPAPDRSPLKLIPNPQPGTPEHEHSQAAWRESKRNLHYFLEHEVEIFEQHPGKIILVYGGDQVKVCDDSTELDAFRDSLDHIQQVAALRFTELRGDVAWIL